MRWFWRVLVVLLGPGMAFAAPEPPPPAGFSGAQYIDGRGCVFTRQDGGWQARLDPSGQTLCGFPPSTELRRLDPDTAHVLPPDTPPVAPDPARLLADRLAEELRNADMTGDVLPTPPEPPTAGRNAMLDDIAATLAHQGAVRSALGPGGRVPDQLCARLGYRAAPVEGGVADATGFCAGLRPPAPGHSFGVAARNPPATPRIASASDTPRPQQPPRPVPVNTKGSPRAEHAAPSARPSHKVEMIPASARYVQIGVFQDEPSARSAIRALARAGLPVVQTLPGDSAARAIMAGPFTDRARLVEVLNRLRAQGWAGAVAR